MNAFRRILVATDLSDNSAPAIDAAGQLADRDHAGVLLFHAIDDPWCVHPPSLAPMSMTARDHAIAIRRDAERELMRLRDSRPLLQAAEVMAQTSSDPAWSICELATERAQDLVVLGSHGRTGLKRLLVGSVAEKVARRAPCSVLVVPGDAALAERLPRTILAAIDYSSPSLTACDLARSMAIRHGADLQVIHTLSATAHAPRTPMFEARQASDAAAAESERGEERLTNLLKGRYGDELTVRPRVAISESAPHAICEVASESDIDLVVVGTTGRTGTSRWLLGSVAERVIRHSAKPVLVVR
jgi:nucleotide-binding universal stress UspA family protein